MRTGMAIINKRVEHAAAPARRTVTAPSTDSGNVETIVCSEQKCSPPVTSCYFI